MGLGCKQGSIGTDMNPIQTERVVDTPAVREEGKEIESELETTGNSYLDLNSSTAGTFGDTSNINTTHGPQSPPLGIPIRRKTEKRKKVEDKLPHGTTEARHEKEETAQDSTEDSSVPQRNEDRKVPSKRRRQGKARENTYEVQEDRKEIEILKEDMSEKEKHYQEELEVLRERLKVALELAQPKKTEEVKGKVKESPISPQIPGEVQCVAITKENRGMVSTKYKGLLINPDGNVSMTLQFKKWADNYEIQMEENYEEAPQHPVFVHKERHPKPTDKKLVWSHTGCWADAPNWSKDMDPSGEGQIVRMEKSINIDGIIESSVSYGTDDTELKVWYDTREMMATFSEWSIPEPSKYYNTRKFSINKRRQREADKSLPPPPPPPTYRGRGRGGFQNFRGRGNGRGRGNYNRQDDEYARWNRQQGG